MAEAAHTRVRLLLLLLLLLWLAAANSAERGLLARLTRQHWTSISHNYPLYGNGSRYKVYHTRHRLDSQYMDTTKKAAGILALTGIIGSLAIGLIVGEIGPDTAAPTPPPAPVTSPISNVDDGEVQSLLDGKCIAPQTHPDMKNALLDLGVKECTGSWIENPVSQVNVEYDDTGAVHLAAVPRPNDYGGSDGDSDSSGAEGTGDGSSDGSW